jgi:hypothetical protein
MRLLLCFVLLVGEFLKGIHRIVNTRDTRRQLAIKNTKETVGLTLLSPLCPPGFESFESVESFARFESS